MKILLDFLPIILFFGMFKYAEGHTDWAARFASDHFGFIVSGGVVGTEEAPADSLGNREMAVFLLGVWGGLLPCTG